MNQLDRQEKEILASYELGEWKPVEQLESEMERYREYARATLEQDRSVDVPISSSDLEAIQKLAIEEGMPFRALMSTIVHNNLAARMLDSEAPVRSSGESDSRSEDLHNTKSS